MTKLEEAVPPASCAARECLEENEGRLVDVEGVYVFPTSRALAANRLALRDGTTVVLVPPKNELRRRFVQENDGVAMVIRGRIFTGLIPERYRIIGRTAEPYLLDLEKIETLGRQKAE